jgi:hypothetical protein
MLIERCITIGFLCSALSVIIFYLTFRYVKYFIHLNLNRLMILKYIKCYSFDDSLVPLVLSKLRIKSI